MSTTRAFASKSSEPAKEKTIAPTPDLSEKKAEETKRNRMTARSGAFRKVEPIDDLMGITPNKVVSKEPEFISVKPTDVWIDGEYQRDISRKGMKLILSIVQNFSWSKFKPPVLTRDEKGRYVAIDGQHTLIGAASHPELTRIPAIFVSLKDVQDQAAAFVSHNTAKVNVSSIDLFYAKLAEGDPETLDIYEILNKNEIELLRYMSQEGHYEARTTLASGALVKLYRKYGKAKMNSIMNVCGECGFRPIRRDHMVAVGELLYGTSYDDDQKPLDPDLLIQLIQSLNDTNSLMQAERISKGTHVSKSRGLAIFWRNQYTRLYS